MKKIYLLSSNKFIRNRLQKYEETGLQICKRTTIESSKRYTKSARKLFCKEDTVA
jgi:hypothetical protein